MLEVKLVFLPPALDSSVVLSYRSFVLKWLDCFCVTICLFVYHFLQAHTAFCVFHSNAPFRPQLAAPRIGQPAGF